jgi:hypothetical protein
VARWTLSVQPACTRRAGYAPDRDIIYGQVTQFDLATGDDNFLADTAHRNTMSYGFFDGENTLLTGNAKHLDDLVEDDVFRASVTGWQNGLRQPKLAATPRFPCSRSTASRSSGSRCSEGRRGR